MPKPVKSGHGKLTASLIVAMALASYLFLVIIVAMVEDKDLTSISKRFNSSLDYPCQPSKIAKHNLSYFQRLIILR